MLPDPLYYESRTVVQGLINEAAEAAVRCERKRIRQLALDRAAEHDLDPRVYEALRDFAALLEDR